MSNSYPIILAHGIAPFDAWSPLVGAALGEFTEQKWDYFKGIEAALEEKGHRTFRTTVPFASRLKERARVLREEVLRILAKSGEDKVHLIGHSMGGLDARCMVVTNTDMKKSVASITTIGTPHDGTPVADWWAVNRDNGVTAQSLALLKPILDLEGFKDLSIRACAENNSEWSDEEAVNGIFYQTYCSWEDVNAVFPPLRHAWKIIKDSGKTDDDRRSDGLVPLNSQRWHSCTRPISRQDFDFQADHLNQVGWWDVGELAKGNWPFGPFEERVRRVYLKIAAALAARPR